MFIMHIFKKAGDTNNVKRVLPKASIAICDTSILRFAQKCRNVHYAHFEKVGDSNNVKRMLPKASVAISGTSIVRFTQKCRNVHHAHFIK